MAPELAVDAVASASAGPGVDDLDRGARRRRTGWWLLALGGLTLVSVPVTVGVGPVPIPPGTVAGIVLDRLVGLDLGRTWSPAEESIVWTVRVPRVLLAVVVGAALAVCGVALQAVVRNVLAEPYLLGISSGASTGAAASILFGVGAVTGAGSLTGSAFVGALLASLAVFALARSRGTITSVRLLLAGVAVGYLLSAVTSFLIFASDAPEGARAVLFWLLGSLGQARWGSVWVAGAATLVALAALLLWSRRLDALAVGDSTAHSLGARPGVVRAQVLVVVALCTGAAVAVAGGIGFVGLVVPHVARLAVGGVHRALLPVAAAIGAIFLVWADLVARTVFEPRELPLGIVTAVAGAPFLLLLVRRAGRVADR